MVENDEDMSRYTGGVRAGTRIEGIDYLLITPAEFVDEFQPLADWKTLKGVKAEIVTLEDIEANPLYAGVDEAERIRSCIASYRDLHGDLVGPAGRRHGRRSGPARVRLLLRSGHTL